MTKADLKELNKQTPIKLNTSKTCEHCKRLNEIYAETILELVKNKYIITQSYCVVCSNCGNVCFVVANYKKEQRKEKPQLTEREKAYLKAYSYDYEWVARDKSKFLYLHKQKPTKDATRWNSNLYIPYYIPYMSCQKGLSFIKWKDEEPYKIKDLLGEE